MAPGLYDPLGVDRGTTPRRPRISGPRMVLTLAIAAASAAVVVAVLRDDGGRGDPRAVVPIERGAGAPPPAPAAAPAAAPATSALPAAAAPAVPQDRDDQTVEIQNGVRIIRPRASPVAPPGTQTRHAPPPRPTLLPGVAQPETPGGGEARP